MPLAAAALALAGPAAAQWTQWGGPGRDFRIPEADLADTWKDGEPRVVWERELGNGNAALVVGGGRVFAIAGDTDGERERVLALDAHTGRLLWERAYGVSYAAFRADYGGPHATPLIAGDRLITVSIDAQVHAFALADGEPLWSRDLVADHGVDLPQSGYAASPLAWGELVLLPGTGGAGDAAIALRRENGRTAWARHAFASSHASPLLVRLGDRDHAVFHGMNRLVGLDPGTGELLWQERLRTDAMDNVSFSPLWDPERGQLYVSQAYDRIGARALRLVEDEGGWRVDEVWTNRRLKIEHGNAVLAGGRLYGSDGGDSAFLVGVDARDGDTVFKQRGIPKATFLAAGDKLLILDEDGVLYLARGGDGGLDVLAQRKVLEYNAWTVPTLVGNRLYLRDRYRIAALELP